jgi:hypothetical protein
MQRQEQMIILRTLKYEDDAYEDTKVVDLLWELLQYAKQKMFYMKPGYPHLRKKESKTQQE